MLEDIDLRPRRGERAPIDRLPGSDPGDSGPPARPRFAYPIAIIVLVVGLAVTAALAFTARSLHRSNEDHLLHQRVAEAGAVLSAAIPDLQTPLSSAAVLTEATNANPSTFTAFMGPQATGRPFVSASVWALDAADQTPAVVVGSKPELESESPEQIRAFLQAAAKAKTVSVLDLLSMPERRLGYAFSIGPKARYVVYAESAFPQNRRATVDSNSAFSDLDYAIYLGPTNDAAHLIGSTSGDGELNGRSASASVPFGDSTLRIVMSARHDLDGTLLVRLPWLIAGVGTVLALAAALMTERLVRRRKHAEFLADQNARLFSEQRSVAQTLQHSLLPEEFPEFAGLDVAVRYVPGVDGVEVGGDWYDVLAVDRDEIMFIVGDVSGRGLRAATVMASLRYAIRAYAAQGDGPTAILGKLAKLIDIVRDGHFATVMCGQVDMTNRLLTLANAGHPSPLLIDGNGAEFVPTKVGPPIGVPGGTYEAVSVTIPAEATLLTYTDGLFERRGENPDVGLARLRDAARGDSSLDGLLDGLLRDLTPDGARDDTAILGIRWHN